MAHKSWYRYYTNDISYLLSSPFSLNSDGRTALDEKGRPKLIDGWRSVRREYRWTFKFTGQALDPADVPIHERCGLAFGWPPYRNPNTKHGRNVSAIIEKYGSQCQLCGLVPAADVDHNHLTGAVRGILCKDCNTRVDRCVHIDSCPAAEYLNSPPAADLRLEYPKSQRKLSHSERARMSALGISDLYLAEAAVTSWWLRYIESTSIV
ncbi:endonuclease domain-containing protein [Mycobacteroides abscessus]|uniref:endonuclease domain-containing protein n=1 Tax=Mycobacteroides abscessus TaxID=36809 RepID=UPI0034E0D240